jgi:hypothetical protein
MLTREQVSRNGRPICWPNPDATCLEGGCIWCEDHPVRSWATIARWAHGAGEVHNRFGGETKRALDAFRYGAVHLGAPPMYHARVDPG